MDRSSAASFAFAAREVRLELRGVRGIGGDRSFFGRRQRGGQLVGMGLERRDLGEDVTERADPSIRPACKASTDTGVATRGAAAAVQAEAARIAPKPRTSDRPTTTTVRPRRADGPKFLIR